MVCHHSLAIRSRSACNSSWLHCRTISRRSRAVLTPPARPPDPPAASPTSPRRRSPPPPDLPPLGRYGQAIQSLTSPPLATEQRSCGGETTGEKHPPASRPALSGSEVPTGTAPGPYGLRHQHRLDATRPGLGGGTGPRTDCPPSTSSSGARGRHRWPRSFRERDCWPWRKRKTMSAPNTERQTRSSARGGASPKQIVLCAAFFSVDEGV